MLAKRGLQVVVECCKHATDIVFWAGYHREGLLCQPLDLGG